MSGRRKSKDSIRAQLTARQRSWLKHLETAELNGETLRDYASRKKLSVHSLYSTRKRLRQLGMSFPTRPAKRAVSFDRVTVVPEPVAPSVAWRLRFPNGAVLESNTDLSGNAGADLIAAIARIS
jgi:hypothetical protein